MGWTLGAQFRPQLLSAVLTLNGKLTFLGSPRGDNQEPGQDCGNCSSGVADAKKLRAKEQARERDRRRRDKAKAAKAELPALRQRNTELEAAIKRYAGAASPCSMASPA